MIQIKNLNGTVLTEVEGVNLRGVNLEGADLRGAYLEGADLRGAYLRGANLEGADLEGVNLEGAYLRGADLRGANLRGADLCDTNLCDTNLEGVNLEGVNLRGANLEGVNLEGAYLRGANLEGVNLRGVKINLVVPVVPNLCAAVLACADRLDMSRWHSPCGTTHCMAGWAVALGGEQAKALENAFGTAPAGVLIWSASTGEVPDFYGSGDEAIEWLEDRALIDAGT